MFSEDQGFFRALAHVFRGPKVLDTSSCFQRPRIFWILAHVLRGPRDFWGFGSCFQRTKVFFFFFASAHANVCGLFTLVPAKYIFSISNRVIH